MPGSAAWISGTMSAMSPAPLPSSFSEERAAAMRSAPRSTCTHGQ